MDSFLSKFKFNLHSDERGTLGVIDFDLIPFEPRRFFWIYDTSENKPRAGHGHKTCQQLIFCQKGSIKLKVINVNLMEFQIILNEGESIFLDKLNWLELLNFEIGSVIGVFASEEYNRSEYIESFDEFVNLLTS